MPVTFAENCSDGRETPILPSPTNDLRRASIFSVMTVCERTARQCKFLYVLSLLLCLVNDSEFSETVRCELPTYVNLGTDYDERSAPPSLPLSWSTFSKRSSLASLLSVKLFFYSELLTKYGKSIIIVILLIFIYTAIFTLFMFCSEYYGDLDGFNDTLSSW